MLSGLGLYLVEQSADDASLERTERGNRCVLRVRRRRATTPGAELAVDLDVVVVAPRSEHARWRSVFADLGRVRFTTTDTVDAPVVVTRVPVESSVGAWRLALVDTLDAASVERALAAGASDVAPASAPAVLLRRRVTDALGRIRTRPGQTTSAERLAWDLRRVVLPLDAELARIANVDEALERIVIEAMRVSRADGGTIYLRDGDHLRFAVVRTESVGLAFGGTSGRPSPFAPLPLTEAGGAPNHRNAATSAFLARRTIHVDDVYHSRQFDFPGARAMDFRTGYRTVSCLTVPIVAGDDLTLGVLQLLNARHAETGQIGPFDPWARELMPWLAARAAVALEIGRLRARETALERASNELRIARDIQARFLSGTVPLARGRDVSVGDSSDHVADRLVTLADAFRDDAPRYDDRTLLVAKRLDAPTPRRR